MTVDELYISLGIRIYMGVHHENRIDFYWTRKPFFPAHPINKLMSLKRFEAIHRLLRLAADPPEERDFESVFDRVSLC